MEVKSSVQSFNRKILYFLKIKKRRPLSWSPTSAHWGNYVEFIEKTE